MAKQSGIIPLEGTIGNLTFLKTADGFLARAKGGVSRQRILSDPAFARTRENGAEFGTAGKTVKLVRAAFHTELLSASDKKLSSRLLKRMMQVLQTDTIHPRGQRTPAAGNLLLLEGFECNGRSTLESVYGGTPTIAIDRSEGNFVITLPPFIPTEMIKAPTGTTHYSIAAACSAIDFDLYGYISSRQATTPLPYDNQEITIPAFNCSFPADSELPILGVLGIQFYQEVNGVTYPLNNGSFNALAIEKVDV